MTKYISAIVFHLFLFSSCFAQNICSVKEVKTEIIIEASVDVVWQKLTDVSEYGNWNPYIYEVAGTLKKGKFLKFRMKGEKGDRKFSARLLEMNNDSSFAWGGGLGFFFSAKHYFILLSTGDNQTKLIQGEYWKGLYGKSFGKKVYKEAYSNFVAMNERLKSIIENQQ